MLLIFVSFCDSAGFLKLYGSTFVKVVDFSLVRGQLIRYWGNTPKMGGSDHLLFCFDDQSRNY